MKSVKILSKGKDRGGFIREFHKILDQKEYDYLLILPEEEKLSEKMIHKMAESFQQAKEHQEDLVLISTGHSMDTVDGEAAVMLNLALIDGMEPDERLTYDYLAPFYLKLMTTHEYRVSFPAMQERKTVKTTEYDDRTEILDKKWYLQTVNDFLLPFVTSYRGTGEVPELIQYYALYSLVQRFKVNRKNRSVFSETELDQFIIDVSDLLQMISDEAICNMSERYQYTSSFQLRRLFLSIKYGRTDLELRLQDVKPGSPEEDHIFNTKILTGGEDDGLQLTSGERLWMIFQDLPVFSSDDLVCTIRRMDHENGYLVLEGFLPDCFPVDRVRYELALSGHRTELSIKKEGAAVAFFGRTFFYKEVFQARVKLKDAADVQKLQLLLVHHEHAYPVHFHFDEELGKVREDSAETYWHFSHFLLSCMEEGRTMEIRQSTPIRMAAFEAKKLSKLFASPKLVLL